MKYMRPDVVVASNPQFDGLKMHVEVDTESWPLKNPTPVYNLSPPGFKEDTELSPFSKYEAFYLGQRYTELPVSLFKEYKQVWLDVGAGSGTFFLEIAKQNPHVLCMAIERDRMRAKSLLKRTQRRAVDNLVSFRGNIIPTIINGIPWESLDRIYILYPCPWPKRRHRKHRWYFHPIMPYLVKVLKNKGKIIWASDAKFYIDEARYICEKYYPLLALAHGKLTTNPYNDLEIMPGGRTKFESSFINEGKTCYELIVEKHDVPFRE